MPLGAIGMRVVSQNLVPGSLGYSVKEGVREVSIRAERAEMRIAAVVESAAVLLVVQGS